MTQAPHSRHDLLARHCGPRAARDALDAQTIAAQLAWLDDWAYAAGAGALERTFRFANYHETLAFVNALAFMVHREDHHPELVVSYNRCVVRFSTHSAGGVTENDFVCAAKADAIFAQRHA